MTAPGEAEATLDCAAETLETVVVHFSSGLGDGPGSGSGSGWGSASTVQLRLAGVAATLPAASLARTEKVCALTVSPERDLGEVHPAQLPVSSLHSKVEPDSVAVKEKLAVVAVVVPLGPLEIVVSGGVVSGGGISSTGGGGVSSTGGASSSTGGLSTGGASASTFQLQVAGVGSTLPALSPARTANWWDPRARAL